VTVQKPGKIEIRKQRWVDFLSMNSSQNFIFLIDYLPDKSERVPVTPDKKKERIEEAWEMYQRQLARMEWLEDDYIPNLDVHTGTEIFAAAFGCPVHYPKNGIPFALPLIHSADEVAKLKVPDLDSSPLALIFEIADELKARAGKEALMRICDIQSPMDIAALIWEKSDILVAMVESSEAVKEFAAKTKDLLIVFLDEWFSRYGKSFVGHCPYYFMPEGISLSEDEVGIVNAEMFEEFFLPELVELSNRYGDLGMHCCADARHQWENFKKIPNLRLLNLCQPSEITREAYDFFAAHVPQAHGSSYLDGPAWTWPKKYPSHAHVVIETSANTVKEAIQLSEKLQTVCRS